MAEKKFFDLGKERAIQLQEAPRIPNKNSKRSTSQHFMIKMAEIKDKQRFLKTEKQK